MPQGIFKVFKTGLFFISCMLVQLVYAETALNQELKPKDIYMDTPPVFKDSVVIQNRAFIKSKKLLFSSYFSFDFSDGPYTMYSLNTDIGYATSETWEFYASIAPVFVSTQRAIVSEIQKAANNAGSSLTVTEAKPQFQYGITALWAPLYGKDTWNFSHIIRSDMFLKTFFGMVNYDSGTGFRTSLIAGKTFFAKNWNLRLGAGAGFVQNIVNSQQVLSTVALFETGVVFYY